MNKRLLCIASFAAVLLCGGPVAWAQNLGNAWHIPVNTVPGGSKMRTPLNGIDTGATVTIYSGNQFDGSGTPGNQSSGTVWYKTANGTWQGVAMSFFAQSGNDKFWEARFAAPASASGVIQYYLQINYTDRATTFLYGNDTTNNRTDSATFAGANAFTFQMNPTLTVNGANANYTTSKFFINEVANESSTVDVIFHPNGGNVDPATVQVYTNLNRRDRATVDADNDGTEDGIHPPSGDLVTTADTHYYRGYTMAAGGGEGRYTLTLPANKTGAYRLSARFRNMGSSTWNYYTALGTGRRDHAITVSPKTAREMVMYELNTINVEATGVQHEQRSTFDDLLSAAHGDDDGFDPFNLEYLQVLGVNWLWFQPIHPQAIQGRQIDPETGQAFEVGSPYAVKNFFDIMPLMGSANTRLDGLIEFQNFVSKADGAGVNVMLDAAFNHTAYDVEFAPLGDQLFDTVDGVDNYGPNSEIAENEARFFSRSNDYANRAFAEANIAVAPDRGDFGKFGDTYDVFYGSYSALVDNNPGDNGGFRDEGDMFFYNDSDWNDFDGGPNSSSNITRRVWKYFGEYIPYWLTQTGCPPGTSLADQTTRGIDGLRADFGQGLPPQAWEYIINKARTQKWSFVFMAESLDGEEVTYRSNRHFDVLNENITFAFAGASTTNDYRSIYERRRIEYGQGLVLLNTTSHDEGNYADPFEALIRFAANGSVDGVPMIFFGQEMGISGGTFGFDRYELNFGKLIPHFKKYNSLKPAWDKVNPFIGDYYNYGLDQLYPVYTGIAQARRFSPALRSSNRFFLNQIGGSVQPKIFSVAKFETVNASPATSDVVFAFANLDRGNAQSPTVNQQGNFAIDQDVDGNGANDYGIKAGRTYDFKNIAAYLGVNGSRRDIFLNRKSGSELLNQGLFVAMNKVPTEDGGWATNPYEAQYLKLYDVTSPSGTPGAATTSNSYGYAIGDTATVSWQTAPADSEGVVPHYRVSVTINGTTTVYFTSGTSLTFTGQPGETAFVTVQSVNPTDNSVTGPTSPQSTVKFLSGTGDEDWDGKDNSAEDTAGTNPLDAVSRFQVLNTTKSGSAVTISWSSVAGRAYQVEASSQPTTEFVPLSGVISASGTGSNTFVDRTASGEKRFYRVRIVATPTSPQPD